MRILQVNSATTLGGGETHVLQLSQKLRDLGHEVFIAGRSNGPLKPEVVLPFRNSADFISALRLRAVLRSKAIDVVHAHLARDYPVTAAAAFGVPTATVVFTRHLLHPVKRNPFYRRVDLWLAPTAEILKSIADLKPKRSAIVPNWIDSRKIAFRRDDLHSPIHIGILGQIAPHKGHDDAIEALRLLGTGFRLFIAGTGDERYVEKLKNRAEGLAIEFVGFASAIEFFRMIDVLIAPSWHEPFGIVLLEAMAAGIPVISTACGGPLGIIESGEHGLLVEPRNPAALASAVRQMSLSPALRSKIVEQARRHVETDFDIDQLVPKIVGFYTETRQIWI